MTGTTAAGRVAATPVLGTVTAHAWHRLATDPHARGLSAIRKLTYLAVAHHADHMGRTGDGHRARTLGDLAAWTGLPYTALVPALAA